ncbi:MAG: hypothetical protein IPI35_21035 [Deltaproteobacteria bacterium]|nr:hypothetical protein [Deltaproteobacteria bacterium]
MQLTLLEVLSLRFGRRLFTFLDGTQFAADVDDTIERLEPAIPGPADLAALDRKFVAVPEHAKDYRPRRSHRRARSPRFCARTPYAQKST